MSRVVLGGVLGAHVADASGYARVQVRRQRHHGGVRDEGRQVSVGRRLRVVEGGVSPRAEVWLLREHQDPLHSVLFYDLVE